MSALYGGMLLCYNLATLWANTTVNTTQTLLSQPWYMVHFLVKIVHSVLHRWT